MQNCNRHLVLAAVAGLAIATVGCVEERERPGAGGVHSAAWIEPTDVGFHGRYLGETGYKLAECRTCHGADDQGGPVGVSCETAGCHTEGVEACGTCHGEFPLDPLPKSGAHTPHNVPCATCHVVPRTATEPSHPNGVVELNFDGVAVAQGKMPSYDAAAGQCANTYCHGEVSPAWTATLPTCGGCHSEPPTSHVRFARVATSSTCVNCHPAATSAEHVDGVLDVNEPACNTCHGTAIDGAPPVALDGTTATSDVRVGAHRRHLDPNLPGRMGKAVPCIGCHVVPAKSQSAGHLDTAAPADVEFPIGGAYDDAAGTCQVWCHFDQQPGPVWSDDSGGARQCDACHGFGPERNRNGTPHPTVLFPTVGFCVTCHPFDVQHHVNGTVDFVY